MTATTTHDWPSWSLDDDPAALARYVLPQHVGRLGKLPGPTTGSRRTRLEAVYEALRSVGVTYAIEQAMDEDGRQEVRTPDQVLWAPRHATCLDLAVVLAGACLQAGLHPAIAILEDRGARTTAIGHALVLVRLDRDRPSEASGGAAEGEHVWLDLPGHVETELQEDWEGTDADWVAIDPVGLSRGLARASTGLDLSLAEAVAAAARRMASATADNESGWRWRVGIDIGSAWRASDLFRPVDAPTTEPLTTPYRDPSEAPTPLRQIRAEYRLVPFQSRHELTILLDFCRQIEQGDRTGLAVVTGVGGSGKTRLALELAHQLREQGWYAGPLPRPDNHIDAEPGHREWLASVVSPTLVVIDYAEARGIEVKEVLRALAAKRGAPAVVVLTARSGEGDWLEDLTRSLDDGRHAYTLADLPPLPDRHPQGAELLTRALHSLGGSEAVDLAAGPDRWTTLDVILLAWLAGRTPERLPGNRFGLYEEVVGHELNYLSSAFIQLAAATGATVEEPDRKLLRMATASTSLMTPAPESLDEVLRALPDLDDDPRLRRLVRRTLLRCLDPAPGEGVAVRPDPIADHLITCALRSDPGLPERLLPGDTPLELIERVLRTLDRAAASDPLMTADAVERLLLARPERWAPALTVAAAQGGTALSTLDKLAALPSSPLPLDDLSAAIPYSSVALFDLGVVVDQARSARAIGESDESRAERSLALSERHRMAGNRAGALTAINEAVTAYRDLAAANPAAYTPNLLRSLRNLDRLERDTPERALGAWRTATDAMPTDAPRAEVLLALAGRGETPLPVVESALREALPLLDTETEDPFDQIVRRRAAILARELVEERPDLDRQSLPGWVTANVGDGSLELVAEFQVAAAEDQLDLYVGRRAADLMAPTLPDTLAAMTAITGHPAPAALSQLLELIRREGVRPFVDGYSSIRRLRRLVMDWLAASTWAESETFYADNAEALQADGVRELLGTLDDPRAEALRALLDLVIIVGPRQAFAACSDAGDAQELALNLLGSGQLDVLSTALVATQEPLSARHLTLLVCLLVIADDQSDAAGEELELVRSLVESAGQAERQAMSIHLRDLGQVRPDLAVVDQLRAILNPT